MNSPVLYGGHWIFQSLCCGCCHQRKATNTNFKISSSFKFCSFILRRWEEDFLTVLLGSMLAILSAYSNACGDGLQRIEVTGSGGGASSVSLFVELLESNSESSSEAVFESNELRVSKHMILSKQPSKPSLLRTLAT